MKKYNLINSSGEVFLSDLPGTIGGHKKLKIYGKLDCKSAISFIKKGHYVKQRVFFENEKVAIEAGYRPCSKCMKEDYLIWKKLKNN